MAEAPKTVSEVPKRSRGRPRRPRSEPIADRLASDRLPDRLSRAIADWQDRGEGRSIYALAEAAGLSEAGLRRMRQPGAQVLVGSIERVAIALGVSPSWLAFGG